MSGPPGGQSGHRADTILVGDDRYILIGNRLWFPERTPSGHLIVSGPLTDDWLDEQDDAGVDDGDDE